MFEKLKHNWNLFRVIRLILGLFIVVQGVFAVDTFSIVLGFVFGGMALFNVGCCGANGCSTELTTNSKTKLPQEVTYEEL